MRYPQWSLRRRDASKSGWQGHARSAKRSSESDLTLAGMLRSKRRTHQIPRGEFTGLRALSDVCGSEVEVCAGDLDDFGETATAGFGEPLSGPDSRWPGHIAADWLSGGE